MADDDRQPFADEHLPRASDVAGPNNPYLAEINQRLAGAELKDDAHFDPASFQPTAPPAQGGGAEVPFWMQGHDAPAQTSQFVTKDGPDGNGQGIKGGGDYTSDDVRKAMEESTGANDVLQHQKQEDMGGRIKDLQSTMEDMRKNKPPTLEKNKPPPKADFSQSSMAYMQVAALMGALAGGFSRKGTTTALTAFSGMIKGLHEGNVESFNQMHQEWKEAEQNVNDVNQAKLDEYNAVWKDQKSNIDQKMEMMKLVATKYDDQITYNTAKMHDFTKLAEFQQKERDHHDERVEKSKMVDLQMQKVSAQLEQMQGPSEDALHDAAQRFALGDHAAFQGFGRGQMTQNRALNMVTKVAKEMGLSQSEINANQQEFKANQATLNTEGRREGNIALANDALVHMAPIAVESRINVAKEGKEGISGWNSVLHKWYVQKGDEEYAKLVAYTNAVINTRARVIAGGSSPHVADQEEGRSILNPSMPPKSYAAAVKAILVDAKLEKQAPGNVRKETRDRMTGKPTADEAPQGWTVKPIP